jgi:hypothetical protein
LLSNTKPLPATLAVTRTATRPAGLAEEAPAFTATRADVHIATDWLAIIIMFQ